jgi:hypothetical protein
MVYQRSLWINGTVDRGQTPIRHRRSNGLFIERPIPTGRSLLSEKYKQEISNHIHEGSAEKEVGGKADDTEGNNDQEKKKDNSAEFRHGVGHSSVSVLALTHGGCRQVKTVPDWQTTNRRQCSNR